jgi:hypothetical protein
MAEHILEFLAGDIPQVGPERQADGTARHLDIFDLAHDVAALAISVRFASSTGAELFIHPVRLWQ